MTAALYLITIMYVLVLSIITVRARRKVRRLARASVIRRIECYPGGRRCTCVK